MSNIIEKAENIMSAFLDGIEAKIKNLTGNHGIDNSHLEAEIKALVSETVTGAIAEVKGVVDQQESDIADLKQAMNDAVDHLSEDNNDAATQVLKTAVEGSTSVETAKTVVTDPNAQAASGADTTGSTDSNSSNTGTSSGNTNTSTAGTETQQQGENGQESAGTTESANTGGNA